MSACYMDSPIILQTRYIADANGHIEHPVWRWLDIRRQHIYDFGTGEYTYIDPPKTKRPGDIFCGFECTGSGITRIELDGGGNRFWKVNMPSSTTQVPWTLPCGIEWPVFRCQYHDIYLHITCEPHSELIITESFRNLPRNEKQQMVEETQNYTCSGPNDLQIKNVVFSSGMVGTAIRPSQTTGTEMTAVKRMLCYLNECARLC